MRGTRRRIAAANSGSRFIPAHAGNTLPPQRPRRRNTVHPRACGEHGFHADILGYVRGSSPRMRGTPGMGEAASGRGRFIPAHAGNTGYSSANCSTYSVHPRACGEHRIDGPGGAVLDGSSPRMRGTPPQWRGPVGTSRFIPAHAGNTLPASSVSCVISVHPRACGEHREFDPYSTVATGSSPRMRGTPRPSRPARHNLRFIPAHAGNTPARTWQNTIGPVHPRACGEHSATPLRPGAENGSSPRMRGTPEYCARGLISMRFIPAHAGNT